MRVVIVSDFGSANGAAIHAMRPHVLKGLLAPRREA